MAGGIGQGPAPLSVRVTSYKKMRREYTLMALALIVVCARATAHSGPSILVNGTAATHILLTPATSLSPNGDIVKVRVVGAAPGSVRWSVAPGGRRIVTLATRSPFTFPGFGPTPTAGPNATFAFIAKATKHVLPVGRAIIVAHSGNTTLSIPAYAYPSLAIGCGLRYYPALSFGPGLRTSGLDSDLYATEATPHDSMDPCAHSVFLSGVSAIHFPYGGVVVSGSIDTFPAVAASSWRNAQAQIPVNAVDGKIILFKTKTGSIVKAIVPVGPYEVTNGRGIFPY